VTIAHQPTAPAVPGATIGVPAQKQRFARTHRFDAPHAADQRPDLRLANQQPVAAVRLPESTFAEVAIALRGAGFTVIDIGAQEVGPRPQVLVLDVPDDDDAARRLLATAPPGGAGRVLVKQGAAGPTADQVVAGRDEVVDAPSHPLQVAAAALRVGRKHDHVFSTWARRVFDDVATYRAATYEA
jgi:hypothetical protein